MISVFYVPVPDEDTGQSLATMALESSQAACANLLGPMKSLFVWGGVVKQETEWVLILKTSPESREALRAQIEQAHPYECPCVLEFSGEANPAFTDWVLAETHHMK